MATNKIETKEDLDTFSKNNYEEYRNLWKRYHRINSAEKQSEILSEINDIQPKIKELHKYNNYCKNIKKQSESIQENLNNFDKNIQKEKDNSRIL